jgi:hypothetical protein
LPTKKLLNNAARAFGSATAYGPDVYNPEDVPHRIFHDVTASPVHVHDSASALVAAINVDGGTLGRRFSGRIRIATRIRYPPPISAPVRPIDTGSIVSE